MSHPTATATIRPPRLLSDAHLLAQYHRDRDPATRDALVTRYLPLARQLARRYRRGGEPLDDLEQVASLGLLKAIERFDPGRNVAFSSFAVPTILGDLKRHFRDRCWSVRVPRGLQELALRVERVADDLARRTGRAPTTAQLAEELGVRIEQVIEAREATGAHRASSLDRPMHDEEDGGTVSDTLGIDDPGFGRAEDAVTVELLASALPARDREILRLRFQEDLTQSEIGARVGISQMQVSRILRQAVEHLRDASCASFAV